MNPENRIDISGLEKSFSGKEVLRGVDLEIPIGTSLVIIGGSGSGKSVLLKHILGLLRPDAGSIKIDGEEVSRFSRRQRRHVDRRIGMLFQNGALFDSMPVWKNVAFAQMQTSNIGAEEARQIAKDSLAMVELGEDIVDLFPASLSGGTHKRIGLARAISYRPDIIFFDEPTTGLDPIMTDVINHLIVQCVQELGATTMTITHDMSSVRAIADKTALLYKGQIIWHGDRDELDASDNPYLRQFMLGLPEGPIEVEGAVA